MKKTSLYERLGLPRDASPEEIRHAYRQLVLQLHPDTSDRKGQTELFIEIQDAYQNLSDPKKKAEYDRQLSQGQAEIDPIQIRTYYSQPSLVKMPEPQLIYSLVEMTLPSAGVLPESSSRLNISLVVDCSTSMQGIRLDSVKMTAIELIRQLHPDDIFSLIKFSDRAELLIPAGKLADLRSAEMKIQLLQAGGGTEIYQGLEMGFAQVNKNRTDDCTNQIILITDGRTYGDEMLCENLCDEINALGIGISALGLGNKWNDVFLDHLTSKTGGICRYISDGHEIRDSILSEITRLRASLTEQISYNYSITEGIEFRSIFRIQPDITPLVIYSPLSLGRMPDQGILRFLIELVIRDIPDTLGDFPLIKGLINYQIPTSPHRGNHIQRLDLNRKITQTPGNESPPQVIVDALSMLSLYRMQERARDEMRKGDVTSATRHLQILATHLLNKGADTLAEAVLDEVKHIELNQSFSEDGEKRIKYGTRALLLPAKAEETQR